MRLQGTRTISGWLVSGVAVATLLVCGAAGAADFSWRQAQGTTLHLLLGDNHWHQVMQKHYPEFEQLTGIRLAVEVYPQPKLWDVLEQALPEPGRVDAFMTVPGLDGWRYLRMGWIRPVNDLLGDPARTSPDFAWKDFLPRARAGMTLDDAVLGPPLMGGHFGLIYRKDVFAANQLGVPETVANLEAVARALHKKPMGKNNAPGVALVTRGNGTVATPLYAALLHALGGQWFEHGQPTMTSRQSVEALQVIGRLLGSYAPPKITDFGWQEASSLFMGGGAAMYLEDSSIYLLMEDPSGSSVAGQVAYAPFPSGPGGPGTTLSVRGLAVAKHSANPAAAWLFCQWAASPENVARAFQRRVLVGRESVWRNSTPEKPLPDGLARSFVEAGRVGVTDYAPPMVAVTAGRQAVGKALEAAIRGEDIRGAAEAANRRLQEILRATEPARAARTP